LHPELLTILRQADRNRFNNTGDDDYRQHVAFVLKAFTDPSYMRVRFLHP
jgi:hypothetical protein